MKTINTLIATINHSIRQRTMTFEVNNTSFNYRVLRCFLRKNYIVSVERKDDRRLIITHRLNSSNSPIFRNVRPLYGRTGRKYFSVGIGKMEKLAQGRSGDTLLLTSVNKEGLIWLSEAYENNLGGILLLQVFF